MNGLIFRVVLIGGDSSNQQAPLMRGEIGNRKSMGHDALRCDRDDCKDRLPEPSPPPCVLAATGMTDAVRLRQVPTLRPKRCISYGAFTGGS